MVHSKNTYYQLANEELQVIHAHTPLLQPKQLAQAKPA
jgi:hypothetical protein